MKNGRNEKANEQQRRKSPKTTAGKDTRKKYAYDTESQQQLARTTTKGNREAIQNQTITSKVIKRDMDNDCIKISCQIVQSRTSGITQRHRGHKQEQHRLVAYLL